MKGHHDIYIMKVGNEYRVRPAVWSSDGLGGSPQLTIRNLTDEKVLLVLPDILASGTREVFLQKKDSYPAAGAGKDAPDIHTAKLKTKIKGELPGAYPYSVFVLTDDGPVQASGESDPVVIIDPPPA